MKNLANITPNDLLTKSDVLRIKHWSYAFFEALAVPAYHIGNRDYFKLIDVDEAIEREEYLRILREKVNKAFPSSNIKFDAEEPLKITPYKHSGKFRKKYPLKYKAHLLVKSAISTGVLRQESCEICNTAEKVQAHHDDYSKPLSVRWLCQTHHLKWHRENKARYDKEWEKL